LTILVKSAAVRAKSARNAFSNATYKLPNNTPIFLGYTVNDFNLSHGAPQKAFKGFMNRISENVSDILFPKLEEEGMILPKERYEKAYNNMVKKFHTNDKTIGSRN